MSILYLVEVCKGSVKKLNSKLICRIKRNESKLPKMSKEYRNEFRKDTIGENVSQETFSAMDFKFGSILAMILDIK